MKTIAEKLIDISNNIDKNIESYIGGNEYAAQNIVKVCRDLIEKTALLIEKGAHETESENDKTRNQVKRDAVTALRTGRSKFRWLARMHDLVQGVVGHDLPDPQEAQRLLVNWHVDLLRIKQLLSSEFELEILANLGLLHKLQVDKDVYKYYQAIGECITDTPAVENNGDTYTRQRYYVNSSTIFQVGENYFYQIQYVPAHDRIDNTERLIAFSAIDIQTRYAVRFSLVSRKVNVLKSNWMPVTVITGYEIAIRPAEWINLGKVVGQNIANVGSTEKLLLMRYLKDNDCSLLDMVEREDEDYERKRKEVRTTRKEGGENSIEEPVTFRVLDAYREIILAKQPGSRVLRYLLLTMRNSVIKAQLAEVQCARLPGLYLQYGCIPFDSMPYCSKLKEHNPKITDLYTCIEDVNREHEHLAKKVRSYCENGEGLYIPKADLLRSIGCDEEEADELISAYHWVLYPGHKPDRLIKERCDHYYIVGEEENVLTILTELAKLAQSGVDSYADLAAEFLREQDSKIDCEDKKQFLQHAVTVSKVAAIFGPAGTGKTYLAELLAEIFKDKKIHFLAHTHAAVNNLMRRVSSIDRRHSFSTVDKYLNTSYIYKADVLFIDECSMITNKQMVKILVDHSARYDVLVLMGDVLQLESIGFGNWFRILEQSKKILPQQSRCELTKTYRTNDDNLRMLWNKVRQKKRREAQQIDDGLTEHLIAYNYTDRLNESFFDSSPAPDSIVLCLNYGGLYGINNINKYLQECNDHELVTWYDQTYKAGDPILFNSIASDELHPRIYNNCKGRITRVEFSETGGFCGSERIEFVVSLDDVVIAESEAHQFSLGCVLVSSQCGERGSTIKFSFENEVDFVRSEDEIPDMPFVVAYAISIHKAQGLEFENVKVVIADEWEEQITHSVFYTAITRSKKNLKIYWTASTQARVLERIEPKNVEKDLGILSSIGEIQLR